jgi:hypothetical protein
MLALKHDPSLPNFCQVKSESQPPPLIAAPQPLLIQHPQSGAGPANMFASDWCSSTCTYTYSVKKEEKLNDDELHLSQGDLLPLDKEEKEESVAPSATGAYPESLFQALLPYLPWQPSYQDSEEMIKTTSITLAKLLRHRLSVVGSLKNSRHWRRRSMTMDPSLWKLLSSQWHLDEVIKKPTNKKQTGVWKVVVNTLERLQAVFGTKSLIR